MKEVKRWIGNELFQGGVYGLGISLAIWIPLDLGFYSSAGWPVACVVAALAGLSRGWAGWPAPAALPWVLACWHLEGVSSAIVVAVLAAAGSPALGPVRRSPARLAFDVGAAALAAVIADGIASRLGTALHAAIAFGGVFVSCLVLLHSTRGALGGVRERGGPGRFLLTAVILTGGIAGGWGLVWLWSHPTLRPWVLVAAALRIGFLVGTRTARTGYREARRRDSAAPDRVRERTAVALARTLPEGTPGGHLWRTEALCAALAERLGSDSVESRRLRQAALLHHIGRVAHEDPSIEVHPRLVDATVRQLGFAGEVRTILAHSREHWNGDGPLGLRGERIARGGRILAVADRYDQLAHPPSGARGHAQTMTLLRSEPGERYDPLMFEILAELAERLEATGGDLTRDPAPSGAVRGGTRLLRAEQDLQALYSIERAAAMPIGLRERLTLIAGLLRPLVPFERLRVEAEGREPFHYGDRNAVAGEHPVALIESGKQVGRLTLTVAAEPDAAVKRRLNRVAAVLAAMIAADRHDDAACLTDPETGLPNAAYLRHALSLRLPEPGQVAPGFGLIAVHVRDLDERDKDASDRFLHGFARRLAAACGDHETALRLGPDQFIVLTAESRGGALVQRWHALLEELGGEPPGSGDGERPVRLDAAHAAFPLDGGDLEGLLGALETRLTGSTAATVLPFRGRRAG